MKNIAMVLLLILVSMNVLAELNKAFESADGFAEWSSVFESVDGNETIYVDFKSIRKIGNNKVKLWYLLDFKKTQQSVNYSYLSSVVHDEFDCDKKIIRMLNLSFYSGNMRREEVVWSNSNIKEKPHSIMVGTTTETVFKLACGKK
ncbi:MAG: hypothetical protein RIQ94_3276 [Pseudomonadota bacterium]